MKKFAVAALSIGLLGALSVGHAAVVSMDAGTFTFSYDDSLFAGSSFSAAGGTFTFSGLNSTANAPGPGDTVVKNYGLPGAAPIVITPKAGYAIVGLTEAVNGSYLVSPGAGKAGYGAGVYSTWLSNGSTLSANPVFANLGPLSDVPPVSGDFKASGHLSFAPVVGGKVSATSMVSSVMAFASGDGAAATATLSQYHLSVQTAAVPEPGSVAMVLGGLAVIGVMGRRRKAG